MADKITKPVHLRPSNPPPYTVEANGYPKVAGETIPRRHPEAKDELKVLPEPGIRTVYDILKRSKEKFGTARAVGFRRLIKIHREVKKTTKPASSDSAEQTIEKVWTYPELSPYEYMSFNEYEKLACELGAGLRKLGMVAEDRLHIFAATSPFWLAMAHGASTQSLPIVTAYDTLGEAGLQHSLCQTHVKAIFLDAHLLPKLVNPLKQASEVKFVIYNEDGGAVNQEDVNRLQREHPGLVIHSFEEFRSLGEANPVDDVPPNPEDLCCIMYTSGSTGPPKGVLLKHKNIVAAVAGVTVVVGPYIGPGDRLLTYLPLAHILEYMFENACLFWGGTMGYGSPKTLMDMTVRNCEGDLRAFRPTVMVGVPAVWESVKKGVLSRINTSIVVRNVFWTAMFIKSLLISGGLGTGLLDKLVFGKLKEATGGSLRIVMSGGGPLAKETQRFISMAICPMVNGYGLTETCGMGAINDPGAWTDQAHGTIPASIEMKLVDCVELGYVTDRTDGGSPQGELWIRGGAVTEGYLDMNNQKDFVDGWFNTGDIGEFDPTGQLKIIDRKKNLVKTLNGEYIALEKLESIYRSCNVVANICVYAAPDKAKPIAIIVLVEAALKTLASQNGISGSHEELIENEVLRNIVLKELQQTGRSGGLAGIEIIEGVVMANEEWNPQNGLTTSAQKINRQGILKKYQKEVSKIYA